MTKVKNVMLREKALLLAVIKAWSGLGYRVSASWSAETQLSDWLPVHEEDGSHWLSSMCMKSVYVMTGGA
ncbi:hypothetical protein TNIN_330361 [Trichonephila inaurata madagascariensis]|uniref:Uncharacterized protein n=1 Tax=Trichonephila inaurata madagascariensis TaxID=2747483 RepID=A0A8X6Y1N9_9ARAC|nr:hypothetical protein TNIN_330361 [Trichonephila inaurata madagascariensis]